MAKKAAAKAGATERPAGAGVRIALLIGPELFLQAELAEELRAALEGVHGRVGTFRFDGASATPAAVLDECRTFGLMEPHKLVIVDNADQLVRSAEDEAEDAARRPGQLTRREIVERYAQAPCDAATLVLRAEKWHKGKLDQMIERVGVIRRCEEPSSGEAAAWAVRRARDRHGATLEPGAATRLVERLGCDLSRLDSEIAKLALNAVDGDNAVITPAAVSDMVGRSREEEVWVIQSALLSGDAETALRSIRDALDVSRHHPVLVSWACVDLARKLHGASRGLAAGARPFELMKALRLWGESGNRVLEAAQRVPARRAAGLLREAVEADVRQKTGAGEPERVLEALALRFAAH